MTTRSPWWYRRRDAVFGMTYGVGFLAAWGIASTLHGSHRPLFVAAGYRWGNAGIDTAAAIMLALMAGCYALRLWGSSYLHARTVWSDDANADSLVIAGPFLYTRNPLYLGNILMALAFGAFAPAIGWFILNLLNAGFIAALIGWEERGLRQRYGGEFDAYCAAVPALLPRLHATLKTSTRVEPSLKEGLLAEILTGSLLLGMIVLLAEPSRPLAFEVFFSLYIAGIVAQRIVAHRKQLQA